MNIDFVAFVRFDFHKVSELESVNKALEGLYQEPGENHAGPTFGGGHRSHRVYGNNEDNPLEEDSDINWIRTVVESNIRGVLDIITLGILSREKIDEILREEEGPFNEYNHFKHKIREYFEVIPTIVGDDSRREGYITYIEPDEEFDFHDEDGFDIEKIQDIISENASLLSRLDFPIGGSHTLYEGKYLITRTVSNDPYNRLGILTRGFDRGHNAPDDLTIWPVWYSSVSGLTSFFRAYYWSRYRREVVGEFDRRTDENRDEWMSGIPELQSATELLSTAHEIHELQLDWVDIYTHLIDELEHLQFQFRDDESDEKRIPFWPEPIEISSPDSRMIYTRKEGERHLISIYTDDVRNRLKLLESDIERVDDKVRKLSSNLHDVVTVGATEENIQLQEKVGNLTTALIVLTVILVILTIALVSIEILSL